MAARNVYRVTKTYGHEQGLSATFRQWRTPTHCHFLHGYPLSFAFTFECFEDELDENGWVVNFGGLKPIKKWLEDMFDHKTLMAEDDPMRSLYAVMAQEGLIQLVVVPRTGCEAFARLAYDRVKAWLIDNGHKAQLFEVKVCEHGGNAAIFRGN